MAKVHYTNRAVKDLSSIWNYTASVWSVKQADEYYNKIVSTVQKLADKSFLFGKKYPLISNELFGYKIGKHIIFYTQMSNGDIKIVRILHGSMDLPNNLK